MRDAAPPGLSLCWRHARAFLGGERFEFAPRRADATFVGWWVHAARAGDALRYYNAAPDGDCLAQAARRDPDLAGLAGLLLAEASLTLRRMSGCRHWRGNVPGRGRVALVQRRDETGGLDYLAVRTNPPRRRRRSNRG